MIKDIFKKADLILLAVLIVIGLTASIAVAHSSKEGSRVVIKTGGKLYGQYSLDEDQEIVVRTGSSANSSQNESAASADAEGKNDSWENLESYNIVQIKDSRVSMVEADCHNQVCVHHRPISKSGESIICLPHKVVVEIISEDGEGGYDTLAQ